jgi:hypothetical protein
VRAWQSILITIIAMDIESAETIHTLQLLETVERNFASSGNELEKLGTLLLVVGSDCSPEPLDLWRRCGVVMILGIALPVVNVNLGQTRNEELKLLLVEYCDELSRDNVMKTYDAVSI